MKPDTLYRLGIMLEANRAELTVARVTNRPSRIVEICHDNRAIRRQLQEA